MTKKEKLNQLIKAWELVEEMLEKAESIDLPETVDSSETTPKTKSNKFYLDPKISRARAEIAKKLFATQPLAYWKKITKREFLHKYNEQLKAQGLPKFTSNLNSSCLIWPIIKEIGTERDKQRRLDREKFLRLAFEKMRGVGKTNLQATFELAAELGNEPKNAYKWHYYTYWYKRKQEFNLKDKKGETHCVKNIPRKDGKLPKDAKETANKQTKY